MRDRFTGLVMSPMTSQSSHSSHNVSPGRLTKSQSLKHRASLEARCETESETGAKTEKSKRNAAYRSGLCVDCRTRSYSAGRPRCADCHADYRLRLSYGLQDASEDSDDVI